MRTLFALPAPRLFLAAAASVTLAACGSADDASTEANADSVEMPADSALAPIAEEPVADPSATATDAPAPEAPEAPDAPATATGDAAADVAAKAAAAAEAPAE